jgi:hypothetical protein
MLSTRSKSFRGDLDEAGVYARQKLSAASVRSMIEEVRLGSLSPLPVIPYAALLALRVSYWQFRMSKVPMLVARARNELLACFQILREIGQSFWSVLPLVARTEEAVREVEKAVSLAANQKSPPLQSNTFWQARYPLSSPDQLQAQTSPGSPVEHPNTSPEQPLHSTDNCGPPAFDDSAFDNLSGLDMDIFGQLDPGFDLMMVDEAVGDDIYFGIATNTSQ